MTTTQRRQGRIAWVLPGDWLAASLVACLLPISAGAQEAPEPTRPLVLLMFENGPLAQLDPTRATQLRAAVAIELASQGWRTFSMPAPEGQTPADRRQGAIAAAWAVNARVALWLELPTGRLGRESGTFLRVVSRTHPEGRFTMVPAPLAQVGENILARLAVHAVEREIASTPPVIRRRQAAPRRGTGTVAAAGYPERPWNDNRPLVLLMMDSGLLQSVDQQRAHEFRSTLTVSLARLGLRTFAMNAPAGSAPGLRRAVALEAVLDAGAMAALWIDAQPHSGNDLRATLRVVSWSYPRGRQIPLPLSIDETVPLVFAGLAQDLLTQVMAWSSDAATSWAPLAWPGHSFGAGAAWAEADQCRDWSPQPKAD